MFDNQSKLVREDKAYRAVHFCFSSNSRQVPSNMSEAFDEPGIFFHRINCHFPWTWEPGAILVIQSFHLKQWTIDIISYHWSVHNSLAICSSPSNCPMCGPVWRSLEMLGRICWIFVKHMHLGCQWPWPPRTDIRVWDFSTLFCQYMSYAADVLNPDIQEMLFEVLGVRTN